MKTRVLYTVECADVDQSLQIRLCDFENYIIQASDDGVNKIGISPKYLLEKYNALWVLMRLTFKLTVLPKYQEEFIIETWTESNEMRMSRRHYKFYVIKDEEEHEIGEGKSLWTIIDKDTRQISPQPFKDQVWENVFDSEPVTLPSAVVKKQIDNKTVVKPCMVEYSDIDINNHFNSCKYLQYMLNACDLLTTISPIYVDIKYSRELKRGEAFTVLSNNHGDAVSYQIINASGQPSCNAVISRNINEIAL